MNRRVRHVHGRGGGKQVFGHRLIDHAHGTLGDLAQRLRLRLGATPDDLVLRGEVRRSPREPAGIVEMARKRD